MSDVSNLLENLFTTKKYNKRIRPVMNQSNALFLDVSLKISSIYDVDEVKEALITTGFLEVYWTDEALVWDPYLYNNVEILFIPQDDIWKPDLVLKNGIKDISELGGKFYYVMITSVGEVVWHPSKVFESRCTIDITRFPFDEQTCHIIFVAWSHTTNQIKITKSSRGIHFYKYEENSEWTIISSGSFVNDRNSDGESEVVFTLRLQRKPMYYLMNIVVPVWLLAFLNLLVFVIPTDAGEKMSYSVTVFLSFAVFLTIIGGQLPINSENVPILGMYVIIQLVYGVLAIVVSAFQLRLRHRKEYGRIGYYVKLVILQRKLQCRTERNSVCHIKRKICPEEHDCNKTGQSIHDKFDWNDVSSSIDYFGFWFFLVTDFIVTVVMFFYAAYF